MLLAPLYVWDTCLSALILSAAIRLAPLVRGPKKFALAGLIIAVATLINPALLVSLVALLGWAAWRNRRFPWVGIGVFLLALAPWTIRNRVVLHAFVPLRDNLGYELWQGNHPGSNGETPAFSTPGTNATEHALFRSEGEIGYMQQKTQLAETWIKAHTREFARLCVSRFFRFWAGSSKSPAPMTVPLVLCALLGLILLRRTRETFLLFTLPLLLYPLPYYITHADVRYQFVIDPLLAILAGYACESFLAWCARRPAPSANLEVAAA